MRARGLKRGLLRQAQNKLKVAPRAGAWIETQYSCSSPAMTHVAPRAGAWIETVIGINKHISILSRPVRARGLKQYI